MLGRHLARSIDESPWRIGEDSPEMSIWEGKWITHCGASAIESRDCMYCGLIRRLAESTLRAFALRKRH
jgi:hypothetical protein